MHPVIVCSLIPTGKEPFELAFSSPHAVSPSCILHPVSGDLLVNHLLVTFRFVLCIIFSRDDSSAPDADLMRAYAKCTVLLDSARSFTACMQTIHPKRVVVDVRSSLDQVADPLGVTVPEGRAKVGLRRQAGWEPVSRISAVRHSSESLSAERRRSPLPLHHCLHPHRHIRRNAAF